MTEEAEYVTIKIPAHLAVEVDKLVGKHGFTSRAEIVKESLREILNKYKEPN